VIVLILATSVVWSLLRPKKARPPGGPAAVSPLHVNAGASEPTRGGGYEESGAHGVTRPT
jgi:hypothetical protein